MYAFPCIIAVRVFICMNRVYIKDISSNVGKEVTIKGWVDVRRDQGKMVFLDLRDVTGKVQAVVLPNHTEALEVAEKLRTEWVVEVRGMVNKRPEKNIKQGAINGDVELEVLAITVLAEATTPAFDLATDGYEVSEDVRLEKKYLDLRRVRLQHNIIMRHKVIKLIRDMLDAQNFFEIETPLLTNPTPEGSRSKEWCFYFKEILCIKGVTNKLNHLMTHDDIMLKSNTSKVKILFLETNIFTHLISVGSKIKRRCRSLSKHRNCKHLKLYISIYRPLLYVFLWSFVNHTTNLNNPLRTKLLCNLKRFCVIREHNCLYFARHITKIKEDHFPLVTTYINPPFDSNFLPNITRNIFNINSIHTNKNPYSNNARKCIHYCTDDYGNRGATIHCYYLL
jgi:hypothetical protein